MPRFQLFRVKAIRDKQLLLPGIEKERTPRELIQSALDARPEAELRKGHTWHIGNLEKIDKDAVYLALGRTTETTLSLFDEDTGNFVERAFENAPYTHVILDLRIQVCAIAAKGILAPSIPGIARKMEKLLNEARNGRPPGQVFTVEQIRNPEEFIAQLKRAYQINRFTVGFSQPNPWDVDKDFQEPLQRTLHETEGESGKATLEGRDLNAEPLVRISRAAAASGDDAEALMRMKEGARPVKRRLRGNPVILSDEDWDDVGKMKPGILDRIREAYASIRRYSDRNG